MKKNPMQEIEIEKMVLNCGAIDDKLEKSVKLLKMITGKKILKTVAKKRIPGFGISPGKEAGCKVTLRNKEQINGLLRRFFATFSNILLKKKVRENHVSFGIHEYIEIPGLEYDRDIGILGFEVDVVFKRKGKRVKMKKIKKGKLPKRQRVTKQEIIDYLNKNFELEVVEKITQDY
jgi:large subunit ribosomal protein L5